jgi:hypothetical protein
MDKQQQAFLVKTGFLKATTCSGGYNNFQDRGQLQMSVTAAQSIEKHFSRHSGTMDIYCRKTTKSHLAISAGNFFITRPVRQPKMKCQVFTLNRK